MQLLVSSALLLDSGMWNIVVLCHDSQNRPFDLKLLYKRGGGLEVVVCGIWRKTTQVTDRLPDSYLVSDLSLAWRQTSLTHAAEGACCLLQAQHLRLSGEGWRRRHKEANIFRRPFTINKWVGLKSTHSKTTFSFIFYCKTFSVFRMERKSLVFWLPAKRSKLWIPVNP